MLTGTCPECQHKLKVPPEHVGSRFQCPKCRVLLRSVAGDSSTCRFECDNTTTCPQCGKPVVIVNADFPFVTCQCGFGFDPKQEQPAFSAPACVVVPSIGLVPPAPTKEPVPWQKILEKGNMPDPGGEKSDRYVLAFLYYAGAVGVAVLGIVTTALLNASAGRSAANTFAVVVGPFLFGGFVWLIREGRKCTARRAVDIVRSGKVEGRPILLLRSFKDDEMKIGERPGMFVGKVPIYLEDVVIPQLERLGPVIAIGKPGESSPPLGAARLWCHDAVWQAAIQQLVAASQFIVIICGAIHRRRGSQWEMEYLARANCADKLILVMPPVREEEASHRWWIYRKLLNWKIPVYQPGLVWAAPNPTGGFQTIVVQRNAEGDFVRNLAAYKGRVHSD